MITFEHRICDGLGYFFNIGVRHQPIFLGSSKCICELFPIVSEVVDLFPGIVILGAQVRRAIFKIMFDLRKHCQHIP